MAFSKPTDLPEWAADGTNTVEPSEGAKDTGWIVDEIPPSSYENWIQRTNWLWWRWWDEKLQEGATNEDLKMIATFEVNVTTLAFADAIAIQAFAKGDQPAIVGYTKNATTIIGSNVEVGVIGLTGGPGTISGTLVDVGVLGSDTDLTSNISNVGVLGHSETDIGVLGLINNASVAGGTLNDVGVAGIIGTFTGNTGGAGVFGYATWGVHGQGTQQGVRGEGTAAGAEGGVFLANSGGDAIVATGYSTGGSGISAGRGIWSTGSNGTSEGGAGIYSVAGDGTTNGKGGRGVYGKGGSGAGTGIDGPGGEFEGPTSRAPLRLVPKSAAPGDTVEGDIYYNSTTKHIYVYNGSAWKQLAEV
jgi:hypothetical protein